MPEVVSVEEEPLRDAIRRALDQSASVLEPVDAPDGPSRATTPGRNCSPTRGTSPRSPKLTVLPTLNPDGYVNLLIRQEVNGATAEVQFDVPVIATRETETDVLVKDGQTVVLGGLREQVQEVVKSGIPVLSALPILGGLFGFEERRTTETELFLFITPLVLRDDAAADRAAADGLERAKRLREAVGGPGR
jgi:hypothetical protein